MRLVVLIAAVALLAAAAVAVGSRPDPRERVEPVAPAKESGSARSFDIERIASGFNRPTFVGTAPRDRALWVLEQPGRVIRLHGGRRTPMLDIAERVTTGAEQGMLGLAFHPDF